MTHRPTMREDVVWRADDANWLISRRRERITPDELSGATFFLGVSLRNPKFSNAWINSVLRAVAHFGGEAIVSLVDAPYMSSIAPRSRDRETTLRNLTILKRQREEQAGRLERLVATSPANCRLVAWSDLLAGTPGELKFEVKNAYYASQAVEDLVRRQVLKAFPDIADPDVIDQLAVFFLEEAPVLAWIYYSLLPGCVDVYPGPQAEFLWSLDVGELVHDLPILTKLALQGAPHTYVEVELDGHD